MSSMTQADATNLFRAAPERYIDVGHGEIAYRKVGTGPDVLFVHGWPVSGATFRGLLPHLVDDVTCHVIDFVGTGSSRFDTDADLSLDNHIAALRNVVDQLGLDQVAVVGHDSGGMIARHALAGDPRLRAMGLINTEQPRGLSFRFKMFLSQRNLPGFGPALGWIVGKPALRRNKFVLGDAFVDRSLIDGTFDEFFLAPLNQDKGRLAAGMRLLKSFEKRHVSELGDLHRKIGVPVQMVWGREDPFFPLAWAEEMVDTFADAQLAIIDNAGLFSHEEKPAEVADALRATLTGAR